MPHNNRMSTSATLKTNEIWSKAIGHDPYAESGQQSAEGQAQAKLDEEKTQTLLQIARSQNTQERTSNDFVAKMYLGLKDGKKRRADALQNDGSGLSADIRKRLEEADSSSEDEFLEKEVEAPPSRENIDKKERKKKSSRRKKSDSDGDDDGDSSDSDSSSERHRSRKHRKKSKSKRKRKHKRRRKRDDISDSESDSDDSEGSQDSRRRRKHRRKRREDRGRDDERRSRKEGKQSKRRHHRSDEKSDCT